VAVSCELGAGNDLTDIPWSRRVRLDAMQGFRAVTPFAGTDIQGIVLLVAQQTIQERRGRTMVEICVIANQWYGQTVGVMAVVTSARTFAAAIKRKAVPAAG
jgi:hypothetical protein